MIRKSRPSGPDPMGDTGFPSRQTRLRGDHAQSKPGSASVLGCAGLRSKWSELTPAENPVIRRNVRSVPMSWQANRLPIVQLPPNWAVSEAQFGLLYELFLGILSTSSGSARSISRRAIRRIKVAVVRPRRSASIAAVSTFRARPSRLLRNAITVPYQRCEMKNPTFIAELHKKLGTPSSETIESLRLLKAFLRLAPRQRFEVIEMVERLATDPSTPEHPLS